MSDEERQFGRPGGHHNDIKALQREVQLLKKRADKIEKDQVDKGFFGIIAALKDIAKAIREKLKPEDASKLVLTGVTLEPTMFWEKGANKMQMTDSQTAVMHIEAQTAEGNPAKLDTPPTYSSSDSAIVIVTPAADGMSAVISSPTPAPLGSAVVTVEAVVKGKTISATLAVDIVAGTAAVLNITTDEPTDV